jgi:hypothetical protein
MKQADHNSKRLRARAKLAAAVASVLLAVGLLAASPASATFETVGTFASTGEEVQLGGTSAMAVNLSGAGGVPAGTVYAATTENTALYAKVVRFTPVPDGSLEFSEAWTVPIEYFGGVLPPIERCGPDSGGGLPCAPHSGDTPRQVGLDLDQTTGNVFVFDAEGQPAGRQVITEFSPDGSEIIARFGEKAPESDTIAASPEKLYQSDVKDGLAIGPSGDVYVSDRRKLGNENRIAVFRPQSPGDFEHYVYAGQSHDFPETGGDLSTDAAGHLYSLIGESFVKEYDPAQPSAPICQYTNPSGLISAMTVDPATGSPFYYSANDRKAHQLSPCNANGQFVDEGKFAVLPPRDNLSALAFDPVRQLSPTRLPGVLYGAAPSTMSQNGKGEPGKTALGYIFSSVQEIAPEVLSQSVSRVTATSAALAAQINPNGSETRYAFQYITDAAWLANEPADRFAGAEEAPLGAGLLGAGQEALSAATALSGLLPDTTYHYRAVATSHCSAGDPEKVCQGTGADEVFRTYPAQAPGLPDERSWELVSPADKRGGQVLPADPATGTGAKPGVHSVRFPMQSAPDGEAVVYEGQTFSPGESAVAENQYIARRSESGWQTTTLSPPLQGAGAYKAFDAGLTRGVLSQIGPPLTPDAPAEYANLYTQSTSDPFALEALLASGAPNRTSLTFQLTYAGASDDLSHVFFEANDALTEGTPFAPTAMDGGPGKRNLYEWSQGQLRLVNVAPGNAETAPGASYGLGSANSISDDGSRAFWSDEAGQLYVRENGESTSEVLDAGKFLAASTDGSLVLLSDGCLYELVSSSCTDLTQGKGGFAGILAHSEDLSHLYFVLDPVKGTEPLTKGTADLGAGSATVTDVHATVGAFVVGQTIEAPGIPPGTTVLAVGAETLQLSAPSSLGKDNAALIAGVPLAPAQENSEGAKPMLAGFNLYAWDQGSVRFVATLGPLDKGDWASLPGKRTAEASPDSRWLAFVSALPLTGYDNTGPCPAFNEGPVGPCSEVFLYDSITGDLLCASCNPSGVLPLDASFLRLIDYGGGGGEFLPQARYLSNQGRLFFDSRDSLSPFDTNDGVEDVYQYEPDGVGGCERVSGCTNLISAGHEPVDSNFLAADPTGKNVFFTTRDQLVLNDRDDLIDVYDAREGGGIAAETETDRGQCQGEACQPPAAAPEDPTPATSLIQGAGNVTEPQAKPCPKGKVKKKGKCVKKHKPRRHPRRQAGHKRGGSK